MRARIPSAKRLKELKAKSGKRHFGRPIDITAKEYKAEVNEAGKGIWVVLLLYKPECVCALCPAPREQHPFCHFPAAKPPSPIEAS